MDGFLSLFHLSLPSFFYVIKINFREEFNSFNTVLLTLKM
ncbi:hypothetical protein DDI_4335 [Dickeya dianthicola RNS04.9]|nr:hypothetical protein DDI_4335 [Dickeya dianthicola RNS04.9]